MDCPRCGSPLVVYALRDRRTLGCDSCGYVGVEVDHHVEREPGETWAEALERFASETQEEPIPAIVEVEDEPADATLTPAIVEIEENS